MEPDAIYAGYLFCPYLSLILERLLTTLVANLGFSVFSLGFAHDLHVLLKSQQVQATTKKQMIRVSTLLFNVRVSGWARQAGSTRIKNRQQNLEKLFQQQQHSKV